MDVFISSLIKMSLRGTVIIMIVLFVRFLLKKLQISHKYIIGLWAMTFFYFVFPWKLDLPVGFWNNVSVPEEVRMIAENLSEVGERQDMADDIADGANNGNSADSANSVNNANNINGADNDDPSGMVDNIMTGMSDASAKSAAGAVTTMPEEPIAQNMAEMNEVKKGGSDKLKAARVIGIVWLIGLSGFFGHMLYSYLIIKNKLLLSVLHQDNIWWAENIDMPMVFGLISPRIYLPVSLKTENLDHVIAHEKMHVKRKDGLFKMIVYMVCLIHWFNPFIWAAYFLFGNDLEKACDEEVIRSMEQEERKEYAYALLNIAAENGRKKKRVFVAPICFDEGNVKSRIKNVMKYKYTLPGMGAVVIVVILSMSVMFLTEAKESDGAEDSEQGILKTEGVEGAGEEVDTEGSKEAEGDDSEKTGAAPDDETETLPVIKEPLAVFRVDDIDTIELRDEFDIEDYYIENKVIVDNRYYIDDDHVLWGYGHNEYGQLGIGKADVLGTIYAEPIKIAENVVSVDCSINGYFCIYLTADGQLYGMGSNMLGLLGQEYAEAYTVEGYNKVTAPVLLMENVAYARAGRDAIVVLDWEGSVWWWGQYRSTYNTRTYDRPDLLYWQSTEDESNPIKMLYNHPIKILEHCIYATTGDMSGAAIGQNGELYTWGLNIFGECGTEVTADDYLRTPTKVLENVRMVWPEKISFDSIEGEVPEIGRYNTTYDFNMFVQLRDGTMLAAGENLGNKEKTIAVTGDLLNSSTHTYSDTFVPIAVEEYSDVENRRKLQQLTWGMTVSEVEQILSREGLVYGEIHWPVEGTANELTVRELTVEEYSYLLSFTEEKQLYRITLQVGGSRNLQFEMGMSIEEVQSKISNDLAVKEDDGDAIYWTSGPIDGSYLGFRFSDTGLYCVFESAAEPNY